MQESSIRITSIQEANIPESVERLRALEPHSKHLMESLEYVAFYTANESQTGEYALLQVDKPSAPPGVLLVAHCVRSVDMRIGEMKLFGLEANALQIFVETSCFDSTEHAKLAVEHALEMRSPTDQVVAFGVTDSTILGKLLLGNGIAAVSRNLGSVSSHHFIKLTGNYGQYLDIIRQNPSSKRALAKQRTASNKLKRELDVNVSLEKVYRETQVTHFLTESERIARSCYKWDLLGIEFRNDIANRQRLIALARGGWLRSYLLYVGDDAIAYAYAVEVRGVVQLIQYSFDPAFGKYGPGYMLTLRFLEELFEDGALTEFRFGDGGGRHKELFSTDAFEESSFIAFRMGIRGLACQAIMYTNSKLRLLARFADRVGIKDPLKRLMRQRSTKKTKHGLRQ